MIDDQVLQSIFQKKLDSLCAKHLHVHQLEKLNRLNRLIDVLAISVPFFYGIFRYLSKGKTYERPIEIVWEILAGLLFVLTVAKLGFKWQEQAEEHSRLLGENVSLAGRADELLNNKKAITKESAALFFQLAANSEISDRKSLGQVSEVKKQFAYREALKELNANCSQCHLSPWNYKLGTCQQCGNTPNSDNA